MKPLTINQAAKLSGITVRTLHYYDEVGLLTPSIVAENGYRLYDEEALKRLQEILFFKELNMPLKDIREIMDDPAYDRTAALKKHRDLLILQRKRLDRLIELLDDNLKSGKVNLKEFDMTEIKKQINKYKEEVKQRWGDTEAYRQSSKKTAAYKDEDWKRITTENSRIFDEFADCMNAKPGSKSSDALVIEWQKHITDHFYDCTDEILSGLADMYVGDQRFSDNINKHGEGLAEFICQSIKNYLKK
ncbi:MAG: MerR family transcriptional regulator [Clostridia bacterium]|nr:MerR family transcriptional regulator [Clostridia bacterium]